MDAATAHPTRQSNQWLPAHEIEQFVVSEIAAVGRDAIIREKVLNDAAEHLVREAGVGDKAKPTRLDRRAAAEALIEFEPVWQALSPGEQRRLMQLLIEQVASTPPTPVWRSRSA